MSPAKLSTEKFIQKSREVHGDKYDYSKAIYTFANERLKIICPKHGAWMQIASSHMSGRGCIKCSNESSSQRQKFTTLEFIQKARKVHGKKYDYSKVEYVNSKSKVNILCLIHGLFSQAPDKHLTGNGCLKCGYESKAQKQNSGRELFISQSIKIHGSKYNYNNVIYKNNRIKVSILCKEHGEFLQAPSSHLQGAGCQLCANKIPSNKLDTHSFIERSLEFFGKRFDYSLTKYIDIKSDVILICPDHGKFKTTADNHFASKISGGCRNCKYDSSAKTLRFSKKEFIAKAKNIWGDLYDYNEVKYVNSHTKVTLECKAHGKFSQTPGSHLSGNGCPKCYFKTEGRIAKYLNQKSVTYREYRIEDKRYDFFLPEYNLIIERDGEQHYRDSSNFSSFIKEDPVKYLKKQTRNDKLKTKLAKNAGFKIARIPYWLSRKEEEIEIENILAGKPTYPDVPDLKQEKTKPKPKKNF